MSLLARLRPSPPKASLPERMLARLPKHAIRQHFHAMRDHGIVYVSVPKVGCTALKLTFARFCVGDPSFTPDRVHDSSALPMEHLAELKLKGLAALIEDGSLRPVAFVRNPYTRALSCYLSKFAYRETGWSGENRVRIRAALGTDPMTPLSFAEFIAGVARQTNYEMNAHWRPQSEQLVWGDIDYAFLGRLENFDDDMKRLSTFLNTDLTPYISESPHATGSGSMIADYYTPELKQRVYDIYKADFEAFGYAEALPD